MKRIAAILLIIAFCLPFFGCQQDSEPVRSPVTFYYRRAEFDHGSEDSVILGQIRDSDGYQNDLKGLLNLYLQGPTAEEFDPTFPKGTKLIDYRVEENTALLTVSDQLSLADGIHLTVACACLAKTVMELTGLETVQIQAQTVMLGNDKVIVMDESRILLLDSTQDNSQRSE